MPRIAPHLYGRSGSDDPAYFVARVGLAYAAAEAVVAIVALVAIALAGGP